MSKLDRETLIMCKNRIMQGQSISSIAREIGIDRKDLKSKILEILSDEEKNEFNKKLKYNLSLIKNIYHYQNILLQKIHS